MHGLEKKSRRLTDEAINGKLKQDLRKSECPLSADARECGITGFRTPFFAPSSPRQVQSKHYRPPHSSLERPAQGREGFVGT